MKDNSVLEKVQKHSLPSNMSPDKAYFESLGFIFETVPSDTTEYKTTLPEGWTIKSSESGFTAILVDENGNERGEFYFRGSFTFQTGCMWLYDE